MIFLVCLPAPCSAYSVVCFILCVFYNLKFIVCVLWVLLLKRESNTCLFVPQMSKMVLNSDDEKDAVETIFASAIDMLSDDDKKLPQASIH